MTTGGLSPRDAADRWREVFCAKVMHAEPRFVDPARFRIDFGLLACGRMSLLRADMSSVEHRRATRELAVDGERRLSLLFVPTGTMRLVTGEKDRAQDRYGDAVAARRGACGALGSLDPSILVDVLHRPSPDDSGLSRDLRRREAVVALVRRELADPSLSLAEAALRLNLTPRAIATAMTSSGKTFGRTLVDMRLDAAAV